jgi:iron complex outermembrane recepter protein
VEFGIDGALAPQWSYRLSGQWTDARFLEDFQFRVAAGGPPAVRRVNAGNRIPGVPRTDAYAELAWSSQASVADADNSDSVAPAQWTLALEARAVGEIAVDDASRAPRAAGACSRASTTSSTAATSARSSSTKPMAAISNRRRGGRGRWVW